MASKGWGLLLGMLGLLICVFVTGTLSRPSTAVVRVTPQDNILILSNMRPAAPHDDTTSMLKQTPWLRFSSQPASDLSAVPLLGIGEGEKIYEKLPALEGDTLAREYCDDYH